MIVGLIVVPALDLQIETVAKVEETTEVIEVAAKAHMTPVSYPIFIQGYSLILF